MKKIEAIIFDWAGTLYEKGKGLFPSTERVLRYLKPNYKLAVISKAVSDGVKTRLKQINEIGYCFDVIIVDIDKTVE